MILTTVARSVNAVSFKEYNLNSIYAVICKPTTWTDDTNPPTPVIGQTAPLEPFAAVLAAPLLLIENEPDGAYAFTTNSGTLHFDTDDSDSDFIANAGNLVMLLGSALGSDLVGLETTFRQVCFVQGLTPTAGHTSDTFLPAAHIASYGNLLLVENYKPIPVITDITYAFRGLIQF